MSKFLESYKELKALDNKQVYVECGDIRVLADVRVHVKYISLESEYNSDNLHIIVDDDDVVKSFIKPSNLEIALVELKKHFDEVYPSFSGDKILVRDKKSMFDTELVGSFDFDENKFSQDTLGDIICGLKEELKEKRKESSYEN